MTSFRSFLARERLVPVEQLDRALQRQILYGEDLSVNLLEMGVVDEDELGGCGENAIEIQLREGDATVLHHLHRDGREALKQRVRLRPAMGLYIADFHVNALGTPEMCSPEHLVCLSHACDVAEENFQFAAVLEALLTLHPRKENIWVGTTFGLGWHNGSLCSY